MPVTQGTTVIHMSSALLVCHPPTIFLFSKLIRNKLKCNTLILKITHELYSVKSWVLDVKSLGFNIHQGYILIPPKWPFIYLFIKALHDLQIFHRVVLLNNTHWPVVLITYPFYIFQWLWRKSKISNIHWGMDDLTSAHWFYYFSPQKFWSSTKLPLALKSEATVSYFTAWSYCFFTIWFVFILLSQLPRKPPFASLNATGWDGGPCCDPISFNVNTVSLNLPQWFINTASVILISLLDSKLLRVRILFSSSLYPSSLEQCLAHSKLC